jgi:hypothetical protein
MLTFRFPFKNLHGPVVFLLTIPNRLDILSSLVAAITRRQDEERNGMKTLIKTRPFKGTWCDRPGVSTEYKWDSKPLGRRIVVHVWADDPDVAIVRAVCGDFWKRPADAVKYEERTVPTTEAEAVANEMARKHFHV